MPTASSTRTAVRRHSERGVYERRAIDAILDEALYCHLGFIADDHPVVIPTIHARVGDTLYVHGSVASRMLRKLAAGVEFCVTATLLDGLVLARSVYKHSMNYRSAIVFGRARALHDCDEKLAALKAIVEHVVPGRSRDARMPNDKELAATAIRALDIGEASAKVRSGPPKDFESDLEMPIWAGVIPLRLVPGVPETEERVLEGVEVPSYAAAYERRRLRKTSR